LLFTLDFWLLELIPSVTAGFAKEVEEVNQYAAVM
jgi:hypothetical protein